MNITYYSYSNVINTNQMGLGDKLKIAKVIKFIKWYILTVERKFLSILNPILIWNSDIFIKTLLEVWQFDILICYNLF